MSDPVTRLNAALEGRYAIERELGEGGMATVYLADDLKHERKVALKVLKPELAAVVGAERFLAEIKTTANLTHPHILPLHDSGEADSFLFYVMPHIEGESLRERIDREKQLPVDEAVKIATDLAEALDYAHRHKIIHRDIKPANILIHEGRPLIADFGIALAVGVAGGGRLTETGLSVGTPHYMSPEQATGDQAVGVATDIYALGAVLYEMLVGEPPYVGSTAQAILGKIIQGKLASATEERASVPANVDAAIRKALEKLPADRFTGAQEFAGALADPGFRHGEVDEAAVVAGVGPWNRLTMAFGTLALASTIGLGWSLLRPEPPQPVSRFELPLPEGVTLARGGEGDVTVSPDGSTIVFVGRSTQGVIQLWQRPLAQLSAVPMLGTENARSPRFSPDGRSVVFGMRRGNLIRTVSLTGGPPQTLVSEGVGFGALTWGPVGMIYFMNEDSGLSRISSAGGQPEVVTTLEEGEIGHFNPEVLPNGRGILFTRGAADRSDEAIAVASLETGETRTLIPGSMATYAHSGHLIYSSERTLYAVPFDPERLEITGTARPIVEGVQPYDFALSDTGVLAYAPRAAGEEAELVWVTRSGVATPVDPAWQFTPPEQNYGWSLSPGGTRVALTHEVDGNVDIWIKQLPDGPFERLTTSAGWDGHPVWTPGDQLLTYIGGDVGVAGGLDAWQRRGDGTGETELLLDDERSLYQPDWSGDGEWLVFRTPTFSGSGAGDGERDILGFRPGVDTVAEPLIATAEFVEAGPELSPDGRWIAYSSNETGREEVYVRPFPDVDSGRVPVSIDGGRNPQWAHSETELFFVDRQLRLIAAQFETDPDFRVVGRNPLFTLGAQLYVPNDPGDDFYDVAPDDETFMMARPAGASLGRYLPDFILVQNFFEELRQRMGN